MTTLKWLLFLHTQLLLPQLHKDFHCLLTQFKLGMWEQISFPWTMYILKFSIWLYLKSWSTTGIRKPFSSDIISSVLPGVKPETSSQNENHIPKPKDLNWTMVLMLKPTQKYPVLWGSMSKTVTFPLLIILTIIIVAFPGLEVKTSHYFNLAVCLATSQYLQRHCQVVFTKAQQPKWRSDKKSICGP